MSISASQETRLERLIERYENRGGDHMGSDELMELRWLAIQAYKEQRKQIAMMRGG